MTTIALDTKMNAVHPVDATKAVMGMTGDAPVRTTDKEVHMAKAAMTATGTTNQETAIPTTTGTMAAAAMAEIIPTMAATVIATRSAEVLAVVSVLENPAISDRVMIATARAIHPEGIRTMAAAAAMAAISGQVAMAAVVMVAASAAVTAVAMEVPDTGVAATAADSVKTTEVVTAAVIATGTLTVMEAPTTETETMVAIGTAEETVTAVAGRMNADGGIALPTRYHRGLAMKTLNADAGWIECIAARGQRTTNVLTTE